MTRLDDASSEYYGSTGDPDKASAKEKAEVNQAGERHNGAESEQNGAGKTDANVSAQAAIHPGELKEIGPGERGEVPASYRPTVEQQQRLGPGIFYELNPQVSVNEMLSITHNKVIKSTPEALDRWAAKQGLEVAYEAKWDNNRSAMMTDVEPFRVVAFRDKETYKKVPGTFVTDRIQTTHVSTSFRSTVESAFEAHDKYRSGEPKDSRLIKHVIDNAKRMERQWEQEEAPTPNRAIQPERSERGR